MMRPMQIASLAYSVVLTVVGIVAASTGVVPDNAMKYVLLAYAVLSAVGNQVFPRSFTTPTGAFTAAGLAQLQPAPVAQPAPPPSEPPAMGKLPEPPQK